MTATRTRLFQVLTSHTHSFPIHQSLALFSHHSHVTQHFSFSLSHSLLFSSPILSSSFSHHSHNARVHKSLFLSFSLTLFILFFSLFISLLSSPFSHRSHIAPHHQHSRFAYHRSYITYHISHITHHVTHTIDLLPGISGKSLEAKHKREYIKSSVCSCCED